MSHPKILSWLLHLLYERTVFVLILLFCVGEASILWHLSHFSSKLIESAALQEVDRYTEALAEFRSFYTSEVVERVRPHGIEVTHDYASREGAIPLPATLSMTLGKQIGEKGSGAQVRLYSAYPFPWRQEKGGLQDKFDREAWSYLRQYPDKPFYYFEDLQGRQSLRYAVADTMRASCVNCHNTHPDTPKNDWQIGEVRGILEVILPLDQVAAQTRSSLLETFVLTVALSVLGLLGLILVFRHSRKDSAELERRASELEREIAMRDRADEKTRDLARFPDEDPSPVLRVAKDGALLYSNQPGLILLDTGDGQIERPLSEYWRQKVLEVLESGSSNEVEMASGDRIFSLAFTPVTDAGYVNIYGRDITASKRVEQEMIRIEHLGSLGRMASGIAHDFNNLLSMIMGYNEMLLMDPEILDDKERTLRYLENIRTSSEDAAEVVRRLRGFYRNRAANELLRQVDLNQLIEQVISFTRPKWENQAQASGLTIHLETDLQDIPPVSGNDTELREVLTNLIFNAVDAMPEGGTITLRTRLDNDGVVIEVSDTGSGMTDEVRRLCTEQ